MSEYGLPSARDSDGDRRATDHSYEWNGQEITIKILPPTVAEAEEYEHLGDDVSPTEMANIIDKHLKKPEIDDPSDMTIQELRAYAEGIFSAVAEENEFAEQVNEELESRGGETGN